MDVLAHGLYGITICSRKGVAGGRKAIRERWYREPTVWWALLFGFMPDIVSMWAPFAVHALGGARDGVMGGFFHHFEGGWLVVYRATHSLLIAGIASGLLFACRRSLFLPSLAWALHIVLDAVSHGEGKFQTLPIYPLSSWGINGIRWWCTPWFFAAYWLALPLIWLSLYMYRRRAARP